MRHLCHTRHFGYPAEAWSHGWRAETRAVMTLYETSLPHKKDTSVTKTLPLPRRGLEPRPESGDKGGGVGQVDMMPASRHFRYPAEARSHGQRAEIRAVMTLYETSLPHKKDTSVTKTLPLPRRGPEPRPESGDKGGGVGQVDMMPASLYHHKLLSPRCLPVCV